jgi:hypothetical protein
MNRFMPLLLAFAVSCGKQDGAPPKQDAAKQDPATPQDPKPGEVRSKESMKQLLDRTRPLLTEPKVAGLVSVAKDHPDLRKAFLNQGVAATPKEGLQHLDQRDADAAKYGFADYYEFAEVRTRLGMAQSAVKASDLLAPKIRDMEAKLAQPGLSDDQRKMYQDGLTSMQRTRDGYLKQLPPEDLEAYRRNKAAVDAALK